MYFLLLLILQIGNCLAFRYKVIGSPHGTRRCLKTVFAADNVVLGKLKVDASDGEIEFVVQDLEHDKSKYWQKSNIQSGKDYDFKFTNVNWYTPVEFCILFKSSGSAATVHLDIDTIDDAHPLTVVHEQLTSNEDQLKNVASLMDQAIAGMEHLNNKERAMRDINGIFFFNIVEATNERVRNFRLMSMISFLAVGAWEIWYLRNYFQSKVTCALS